MINSTIDLEGKTIFITGIAGFIGANLAKKLYETFDNIEIVGIDNMNDYYDVRLKKIRLKELVCFDTFNFIRGDLDNKELILSIFKQYRPQIVVNLGAQAGVRYSIINPDAYISGNLVGFFNILEGCRQYPEIGRASCRERV